MIATVLAGRDEDLGVIQTFLDDASAGGAALLLTGEAGVGKTAVLPGPRVRRAPPGRLPGGIPGPAG